MLSPRTGTILKSIVEQYITRAVPVPSKSIIDNYHLEVSSATVRNEMVHLENEGYIIRPHISAGSVPLDKGYRYYVESLSDIKLPITQQRMISHLFHQVETKLEEWLRLTATLLAHLAQNTAIVAMPKPASCVFKYLQVLALRESTALIVLILHGARVKQQLIAFDQTVAQSELATTASKLNAAYQGLTCRQISAKEMELSSIEQTITDCVVEIMRSEDKEDYEESYLDGLHFTLNQPEFIGSPQMASLIELTEHRNLLSIILPKGLAIRGVRVIIGKENREEAIQNYSVVISQYGLPGEAVGSIGIIGPTRMPYARSIASVDYLSSLLSSLVARLYERETSPDASEISPTEES
jgi:heat-inducible transcriptional repressor